MSGFDEPAGTIIREALCDPRFAAYEMWQRNYYATNKAPGTYS